MTRAPRVSLVVLNFDGRHYVRALLRSLLAQTHRELEILVVDNGSTDDSADVAEREFPDPRLRVLRLGANRGFSAGNNAGIRAATGDYVMLLNNDVVLEPDCVAQLIAAAPRFGRFGALAPKILWLHRPEYIESVGTMCTADGTGFNHGIGHIDIGQFDRSERVFGACFAAVFFRRAVFEEVGFLEESYFMYYEDTDWNFRANRRGFPVFTVPAAVVRHVHSGSLRHTAAERKRLFLNRNWVRFGLLNLPDTRAQLLRVVKVVSPLRYWRILVASGDVRWRVRSGAHLAVALPGLLRERRRRMDDPLARVPFADFLALYEHRDSFFLAGAMVPEASTRALASSLRELFRSDPAPLNALRWGSFLALVRLLDMGAPAAVVRVAVPHWEDVVRDVRNHHELVRVARAMPDFRPALGAGARPAERTPGPRDPGSPGPLALHEAAATLGIAACATGHAAPLRALGLVLAWVQYVAFVRGPRFEREADAERAFADAWDELRPELTGALAAIPGGNETLDQVARCFRPPRAARTRIALVDETEPRETVPGRAGVSA